MYKLRRFEQIKNGDIITYEDEYDSDDDMADSKFYNTQKIDMRHASGNWVSATVLVALDEMMNLHYVFNNQNKGCWMPIDSDDIAPHMSMQQRHDIAQINHNKAKLEEHYQKKIQESNYNHEGSQNLNIEESGSHNVMSESNNAYSNEGNENSSVSD